MHMKFIDEAIIYIKAGDGGRGCVSFRREKYVPRGGPDGGNGGKGGDIIIKASHSRRTLLDLKFKQHYVAEKGEHGKGNNKTGSNGKNVEIIVPVGTVIKDADTNELLADLSEDAQFIVAATGGKGGKGNAFFVSSVNQAPNIAQDGIPGEERKVHLELKLLADVGIIGFPNVGKSTFISKISAARPKIADYPFTTVIPNLGVVKWRDFESFVIADIPGLIKGAHMGMGMGVRFLRHIERASVLLHIIDISGEPHLSAWDNFETINQELACFNPSLTEKPQIVAINKIDLTTTRERIKKDIDIFKNKGLEVFGFSAITGEGVDAIIKEIVKVLSKRNNVAFNLLAPHSKSVTRKKIHNYIWGVFG